MKASEIRKMSAQELDAKLLELKDELFKLRFVSVPLKRISQESLLFSVMLNSTAKMLDKEDIGNGQKFKKNSCRHGNQRQDG